MRRSEKGKAPRRRRAELTEREEAFARRLVEGRSAAEAYREVYPSKRRKDETTHQMASRLKRKVSARVRALQEEAASAAVMSARELQEGLSDLFRAARERGNIPGAVAAGRLLADLAGYNAPVRSETALTLRQGAARLSDEELARIAEGRA